MAYTDAKKAAIKRYMAKQERISIWCSKEEKETIQQMAKDAGKSVNSFIKDEVLKK